MVFASLGDEEILVSNDKTDFCFEIPEGYTDDMEIYAIGRTNYDALVADIAISGCAEVDGITYRLNTEDNTAKVKSGVSAYSGSITIPESITYNEVIYSVNGVESGAFANCTELLTVTIPASLTSIGTGVFSGSTGLRLIDLRAATSLGITEADRNGAVFSGVPEATVILFPGEQVPKERGTGEAPKAIEIQTAPPTVITAWDGGYWCHEIKFDNNEDLNIPVDFVADKVTNPRTIPNDDNAYTICLAYNLTLPEGVKAYSYKGVNAVGNLLFTEVSSIEANKPYLVVATTAITNLDATNVMMRLTPGTMPNTGDSDYEFHGTLSKIDNATAASMGAYILKSDLKWYPITFENVDDYIASGQAFLVPKSTNPPAFIQVELKDKEIIKFVDSEVKRICVENWDTDDDGELSMDEAKAVTDLGTVFKENQLITSFDELQYFTGLTKIANQAFWYSKSLKSVTMPETVTELGYGAFGECSELIQINLPDGIKKIDNQAFVDCKLTSVNLPTSLEYIGYACFTNVPITSIYIPASVNYLYYNPFEGCNSLETITVDKDNSVYYSPEGSNAVIKKEQKELVVGCKRSVIPSDVTAINSGAFSYYDMVTIDIPESVTKIRSKAFLRSKITNISIPKTVTEIGNSAFYDCKNLKDVTVYWKEPLAIEDHVFSTQSNATLHVPAGTKALYKAADYWKVFKDIQSIYAGLYGTYSIEDNDEATLTDGSNLAEKEMVIPQSLIIDDEEYAVTAIGEHAFANNTVMTQVTIPETITEIGNGAFAGCTALEVIYCLNQEPVALGSAVAAARTRSAGGEAITSDVFTDVNKETCVLYVPAGSKKKYAVADGWKEFKTIKEFGGSADKRGDANSDKKINVADIVEIVNFKKGTFSEQFNEANADVNADGIVDDEDIKAIEDYLMNGTPATLSELKAQINIGRDCSDCLGWYVDGDGNISESDANAVGRICYVSTSDVDIAFAGSRILVLANNDLTDAHGVTWGVYGLYMHLNATKVPEGLCGYNNTNTLQAHGHGKGLKDAAGIILEYETGYPAACFAWNYGGNKPIGASHWFLPSFAQWKNMLTIAGKSGTGQLTSGNVYWSSTDNSASLAYFVTQSQTGDNPKSYSVNINNEDACNKTWSEWAKFCARACYVY